MFGEGRLTIFRRKNKKTIYGGYKNYRSPKVFSGSKIREKKSVNFPKISFTAYKRIFVVVIVLFLVGYFLFSPRFSIKEVIIEGNNLVLGDTLKSYIPLNGNIFRFNGAVTKDKILAENPEIKSIQIIRGLPDAIKISVIEHDNRMIWQSGSDKYLVSVQGVVSKKINEGENFNYPTVVDSKSLPVAIGKEIVDPSFVAFVNNINDKFFDQTNIKPTTFEVQDTTFDVNLHTEAGFYVKFNTLRSSAVQLENLKKVLVAKRADIHEYIDLRIDGWAYYK